MTDTSDQQAEQTHSTETSGTQRPASDGQADFEELKEATQHFFNTLVRVGMHLATTPVSQLPEESREHFANAAASSVSMRKATSTPSQTLTS
jgi:hypothetical protein